MRALEVYGMQADVEPLLFRDGDFLFNVRGEVAVDVYQGQIILFACLIASYVIVKCNIAVAIYEESITYYNNMIISASDAWLATIVWSLIGWIPNLVSTILLRKYGREYRILLIISWILYLLVGPTGITNPIPMGV